MLPRNQVFLRENARVEDGQGKGLNGCHNIHVEMAAANRVVIEEAQLTRGAKEPQLTPLTVPT